MKLLADRKPTVQRIFYRRHHSSSPRNQRSDGSGRKGGPHQPFLGFNPRVLPVDLPATDAAVADSLFSLASFKEIDPAAELLVRSAMSGGARALPQTRAAVILFDKKIPPVVALRMMRDVRYAAASIEQLVQFRLATLVTHLIREFRASGEAGILALGSTLPGLLGFREVPLIAGYDGEFLTTASFEAWMSPRCGFLAIPL